MLRSRTPSELFWSCLLLPYRPFLLLVLLHFFFPPWLLSWYLLFYPAWSCCVPLFTSYSSCFDPYRGIYYLACCPCPLTSLCALVSWTTTIFILLRCPCLQHSPYIILASASILILLSLLLCLAALSFLIFIISILLSLTYVLHHSKTLCSAFFIIFPISYIISSHRSCSWIFLYIYTSELRLSCCQFYLTVLFLSLSFFFFLLLHPVSYRPCVFFLL